MLAQPSASACDQGNFAIDSQVHLADLHFEFRMTNLYVRFRLPRRVSRSTIRYKYRDVLVAVWQNLDVIAPLPYHCSKRHKCGPATRMGSHNPAHRMVIGRRYT